MHPAISVIFFTTSSGIGYGLAAMLGLMVAVGELPADAGFQVTALILAYGFVTAGLLSSTAHLGHPERAWRALSQWRTSWLSREGVSAIVSFAPAGLLGLTWIATGSPRGAFIGLFAILMVAMALITIYCTAMIYASLATIHQWHNGWVVPNYFLLALLTGTFWLNALLHLWRYPGMMLPGIAGALAIAAVIAKLGYWRFIDTTSSASTAESATGLGAFGKVRLFEAPHTEQNYLMREMGFRVARKHVAKLRVVAFFLSFVVPAALIGGAVLSSGIAGTALAGLAAVCSSAGVLVERWLFFAEAKHTVTLYYGASKV
jgi:DMSO reductase anchor subunit